MKAELKSKIIEENGVYKYFDKEGNELHDGDIVVFDNDREEKLHLTSEGELGIDATNRKWIETGKAYECEFGIYPLDSSDMKEITLKKINTKIC